MIIGFKQKHKINIRTNCIYSKKSALKKKKSKEIENKGIKVESVIQQSIGTKPALVRVIKVASLIIFAFFF